jgi:hypothetical protein
MRGLALCLVAGALVVAGCGSDDNSSSNAPQQQDVAASGGTTSSAAGVSAKGRVTVASLCTAEGKGKPKKQCVAGLKKLDKGKAANPRAACKGLSKKKTKGVRGKSPYAVCVSAAAKLMASKKSGGGSGNGAADSNGNGNGSGSDDESDDGSDSPGKKSSADSEDEPDPICRDASGKEVPFDSEDVEECDAPASASSSDDDSSSSSFEDDSASSDDDDE